MAKIQKREIISYKTKSKLPLQKRTFEIEYIFNEDDLIKLEDVARVNVPWKLDEESQRLVSLKAQVTPGRYGVIMSLPSKTHWFLDLLSRVVNKITLDKFYPGPKDINLAQSERKKLFRNNASGMIEIFLGNMFRGSSSEESLTSYITQANDYGEVDYLFIKSKEELTSVFYCKMPTELVDETLSELFIPDHTFHIIPCFKYLLLGLLKPSLLEDNEIFILGSIFEELLLVPKNPSNPFDPYKDYPDKLSVDPDMEFLNHKKIILDNLSNQKINIDFKKVVALAKKEYKRMQKPNVFYSKQFSKIFKELEFNYSMIKICHQDDLSNFEKRFNALRKISKKQGKINY